METSSSGTLSRNWFEFLTEEEKAIYREYSADPFLVFKLTYQYRPLAFVTDCINFPKDTGVTAYQKEILSNLVPKKRISARAPRGAGKSAMSSWVILWAVLTSVADCKVITTASSWQQLIKFLWPEVHKWAQRLRWDKIGRAPFTKNELMTRNLKVGETIEAFPMASSSPERMEGAHASRVVCIFDEAKIIPAATWDAMEGTFSEAGGTSDKEAYAVAISTPGAPSGRFYDIHSRKSGYRDWWTRHVKLEETLKAGRITQEWVTNRKLQWGEDSAMFRNHVLAEFYEDATSGVIPLSLVEKANQRWYELHAPAKQEVEALV